MSNAERQASFRARRKLAVSRAATRCRELVLIEERIERGVAALWSAVDRSEDEVGSKVTADSFREDFFLATRSVKEDVVRAYRPFLTADDIRAIEASMRIIDDLALVVERRLP